MVFKYFLSENPLGQDDFDALIDWLRGYPQLSKGPLTPEFEAEAAAWVGKKHAVFVNSGSSANFLMVYALILSNKMKSKKIVVPSVSWVTTVSPAIQLGLEPIMIGPDPETFGIDLNDLERVCKKDSISAVLYVDVLGIPHHREELKFLQNKYGFFLLEDACAALGSKYKDGTKLGSTGDMSTFSTYMGHQCVTIEGGLVFTDSDYTKEQLLMLRSHGFLKDLDENAQKWYHRHYNIDEFNKPFFFCVPGLNLRNTDIGAFLGLRQIKKLDDFAEARHRNHQHYYNRLKGSGLRKMQTWQEGERVSSISFGAVAWDAEQRRKIVQALNENGVENRMFSAGNIGRHPFWYERYGVFEHPLSDAIHNAGFFVPNYATLELKDVDFICDVIQGALN